MLDTFMKCYSFFPIAWMCLFYWRWIGFLEDFLKIFFSIRYLMTRIMLHLPVICWFDMDSMTCCTVVVSFLIIIITHTLVLFIEGDVWFHGIFFIYWETYDMLWCSQYCSTIPTVLPFICPMFWYLWLGLIILWVNVILL